MGAGLQIGVQAMVRFGSGVFSTTASARACRLLRIQLELKLVVASANLKLPNMTEDRVNSCSF